MDDSFDFEANNAAILSLRSWQLAIYDNYIVICFVFKILVIIFFAYNFAKKVSSCLNYYFYLLSIGFIPDTLATAAIVWNKYFHVMGDWYFRQYDIEEFLKWYSQNFAEMWTFMLILNRLTAIIWWQSYDEIWAKHFWKVVILVIVYPFLIGSWSFFNPQCRFEFRALKCKDKTWHMKDVFVTAGGSIALSSLSFLASIITAVIYRVKIKKELNLKQNPDWKMLFHALVSSFTLMFYWASRMYWEIRLYGYVNSNVFYFGTYDDNLFDLIKDYLFVLYNFWTYVFLFVFSTTLRQQFFQFYYISQLFSRFYKRPSKVRVIQISSVAGRSMHQS